MRAGRATIRLTIHQFAYTRRVALPQKGDKNRSLPSTRSARTPKRASGERLLSLVLLFSSARRPVPTSAIVGDSDLGYGSDNAASDRRKFRRDRDELAELGFIVREVPAARGARNEESSWELDRNATYAEQPELPVDDLLTLIHGIEVHARRPLLPYRDDLARALVKLKAVCAQATGDLDDAHADAGEVAPVRGEKPVRVALDALWSAWRQRRAVSLRYRTASGDTAQRTVALYGMFAEGGFLYFVGADLGKEGTPIRTFRADRILDAGKLGQPYRIPEDFSIDAHRFFPFGIGAGADQPASFSLPASLPAAERQRITHGAGTLEKDGERLIWTVPARSVERAAAYAFEYASRGVRPLAPAGLVACWNDTIDRVVSAYGRSC